MAVIKLEKGDENHILFVISDNEERHGIPWDEILKYWKGGRKQLVKNAGAFVQGPGIVGWCTYANGASGVIFVWDTVGKKILHVSDGSFTRKALLYGNLVFSLREIPKQDTSDLMLCYSPVRTLDGDNKKLVTAANLGITIFDRKFNIDNYKLAVKNRQVVAGFRDNVKMIRLVTPDEAKAEQEKRNNITVSTNSTADTAAETDGTDTTEEN